MSFLSHHSVVLCSLILFTTEAEPVQYIVWLIHATVLLLSLLGWMTFDMLLNLAIANFLDHRKSHHIKDSTAWRTKPNLVAIKTWRDEVHCFYTSFSLGQTRILGLQAAGFRKSKEILRYTRDSSLDCMLFCSVISIGKEWVSKRGFEGLLETRRRQSWPPHNDSTVMGTATTK